MSVISSLLPPLLDLIAPAAQAQTLGPGGDPQQSAPGLVRLLGNPIFMIAIMVPLFYFMMIRPQMKRSREARDMLAKLAKGDEVVINGGLAGRVVGLGENYATVEIAEKVEVKVQKSAIGTVLPKGSLKNL